MNMTRIYVIGIGYRPHERETWEIIERSHVIVTSQRLFDVFKAYEGFESVKARLAVITSIDEAFDFMKAQLAQLKTLRAASTTSHFITLLASGDPLFHGIGRRALEEFGKEAVEIIPDLSCMQVAFSRIKEPWDDAFLMSLHGGPDPARRRKLPYELSDVPFLLERHKKLAILTDKVNNPVAIARQIATSAAFELHPYLVEMHVCERLNYPDERVIRGTPSDIVLMQFADPNVVIVKSKVALPGEEIRTGDEIHGPGFWVLGSEIRFGLKEDEILHTEGLITKDEVRAVAIHKLRLPRRGVFWDIGAGSGSVSIEAARLSPGLRVFAVEKDEEQVGNIRGNKIRFTAHNVEIVAGVAPEILKDLPPPDRVFIGGSGRRLAELIALLSDLPADTVVVNATKIETLQTAVTELKKADFIVDVTHLSASRMKNVGDGHSMSALNPVFVIRGVR